MAHYPSRGRARFGVLVPFTNTNLESDMGLLRPNGVSLHFARMGGYESDEIPDADQMHGLGASDLQEPLNLLMGARPDVILYGCTSATLTHGPAFDRGLADRIATTSGAKTVTAAGALLHALAVLKITRIGFASPYVSGINDMAVGFLAEAGVGTVKRAEVDGELGNYGQGELDPDAVFDLAMRADHPQAQGLVLSCTDMRSIEVIARVEQAIGKPVISSNQAMVFQAMQLAGINDPVKGFGLLMERSRL